VRARAGIQHRSAPASGQAVDSVASNTALTRSRSEGTEVGRVGSLQPCNVFLVTFAVYPHKVKVPRLPCCEKIGPSLSSKDFKVVGGSSLSCRSACFSGVSAWIGPALQVCGGPELAFDADLMRNVRETRRNEEKRRETTGNDGSAGKGARTTLVWALDTPSVRRRPADSSTPVDWLKR